MNHSVSIVSRAFRCSDCALRVRGQPTVLVLAAAETALLLRALLVPVGVAVSSSYEHTSIYTTLNSTALTNTYISYKNSH